MGTLFIDSIISAQVINGVVRIRTGVVKKAEGGDTDKTEITDSGEIFLPVAGFTELANACNRIAIDLVDKGLLSKGNDAKAKIS
tara:strand:- start:128 stop:379 length:252 start_codon:yes stop_codon:yes gene_type:complete